ALAGCAGLGREAGFDAMASAAAQRVGATPAWPRDDAGRQRVDDEVAQLLAQTLTADDAVQVAVLQNPALQAVYGQLGVAEAELLQAGRLPNPRFRTTRTASEESFKYETALTLPLGALLTLPAVLGMEQRRFEAVRLQVTDRVLAVAADTREAWVAAVAAQQELHYLEQVREAAEASAVLAQRMARVGHFSQLDQLREQAYLADARVQLGRARGAALAAHERLMRLLGVDNPVRVRLPERLPELPPQPGEDGELERFALGQRLDVQAAKADAAATARALGLSRAIGMVNTLELGPARLAEQGEPLKRGYEVSVEIPIFDWGGARVARAQAVYLQAAARVGETAVNARSEVRESAAAWREAGALARQYRDEIVPLRRRISEQNWLRYNGMLISVFELLADAREQVNAAQGSIGALRDYWLAEARLRRALGGRLPAGAVAEAVPAAAAASTGRLVRRED
ncbi:MAG: TolC family protein, partial [Betaproteobacteria bacterium]